MQYIVKDKVYKAVKMKGIPMLQKISICIILLLILVSCSQKSIDDTVVIKPGEPKAGDKITIKFFPKRLINPEQKKFSVYLVWQLFESQGIRLDRIQMEKKSDCFIANVNTKESDCLLSIKFEDSMDRCEDNSGRGWNIMLENENGEVQRNASHQLGLIYNNTNRKSNFPDHKKAKQYFENELAMYPDNYKVWFDLWFSRLRLAALPAQELKNIQSELDSLLSHEPAKTDLYEVASLAFKTNLKLLNKPGEALKIGEKLIADFDKFPQRDKITYSLIFLRNGTNQQAIVNDLTKFIYHTKNKDYLKKVNLQLGMFYRRQGRINKSIHHYEKCLQTDSTNTSTWLALANDYLRKGRIELSQQMITNAREMNTPELIFSNNPWDNPADRISKSQLTECQILSTEATINYKRKDFKSAIKNRKKCIALRTPFPAYEWEKIGDIFMAAGEQDSAHNAYIKAVSLNSTQNGAIDKLKILFRKRQTPTSQFNSYLSRAIRDEQKASAKPAPDILLTDLQSNKVDLNGQKGKITVLIFWDTWSEACQKEVEGLNELKENFYDQKNVSFWAVSVEDPASIKKFIRDTPINFRLFHSGFSAKRAFDVIGFPTHLIIDGSGKIRFTHVGFSKNIKSELKEEIQLLLDELKEVS